MRYTKAVSCLALGGMIVLAGCGGHPAAPAGAAPEPSGAVSTATGTTAAEGRLDVPALLRGKAPGLEIIEQPDGSYTLRIRGISTINTTPPPLILVDGIEVRDLSVGLAGLTRQDISSVEVLRDVASTAIYGTRGAGGVILIRTRRSR